MGVGGEGEDMESVEGKPTPNGHVSSGVIGSVPTDGKTAHRQFDGSRAAKLILLHLLVLLILLFLTSFPGSSQ
ncbi:hypothetical protein Tco_0970548 [Tanacetum coccineum]